MGCGTLQGGLFANCQEWRFQPSKRSYMSRAILPEGRYADAQESRFQGAKLWNMGSAIQQLGQFAYSQESRIQAAKRSEMGTAVPQAVDFLILRNRESCLRDIQRPGVPSRKDLICWCYGIAYSGWETSDMGSVDLKELRSSDAQESRYEAWNRLYMDSAVLLGGRFADVQVLRFQTAKCSVMECTELQGFYLLIIRNGVFRMRKGQIWAVLYC